MNVFELFGTIAIDGTKANGALDKISKNARATGKAMQDAFNKIGSVSVKVGKVVAGAGVAVGGAWVAAIEGTRDYRTEMAKLDAAFTTNGHSAEAAKKTYQDLQAVLGETDQSVEAANHLAVMCKNEEELAKWTDICTGIFATFGDSLPIEGLTESANETAKVGQVTGSLADALNWAGISEEDFNLKLRACRTEQERQNLIMNHLTLAYKDASEQYQKTAEDIMNANRAQESWNSAMAALGAIGEPILTAIKQKTADMVLAAVPHLETFITKFREIENVWTDVMWPMVQSTFKVAFGVDVPEWSAIETNITTWWTETAKPAIEETFKATFGIAPPEWSALPETITTWWTQTAKPKIEETAKAIMSITPPDLAGLADTFNVDWTKFVLPTLTGLLTGNLLTITPMIGLGLAGLITSNWDTHIAPVLGGMLNQEMEFTPPDMTALLADITAKWNTVIGDILNLCNVPVSLNPSYTNENGVRWSEVLADWFHGMAGEAAEHLKVAFNFVMPTAEETAKIQQDMTTWLHGTDGKGGIVGLMANAISFPFELAFQECVNVWEDFQKWLAGVNESGTLNQETYEESEWTKGAKYDYRLLGHEGQEWEAFNKWIQATNLFRETEKSGDLYADYETLQANVDAARNAIESAFGEGTFDSLMTDYMSWLGGQVDAETQDYFKEVPVSLTEDAATNLQSDLDGMNLSAKVNLYPDYSRMSSASNLGRVIPTSMIAGSHATGLDYVPRDNYIANLHKGEAVLTSSQAAMWRSGSMGGGDIGRLEAAINNLGTMLQQISANTAGGHQVILDSGALVGQLAPAMDVQLGTISGRKGRRA